MKIYFTSSVYEYEIDVINFEQGIINARLKRYVFFYIHVCYLGGGDSLLLQLINHGHRAKLNLGVLKNTLCYLISVQYTSIPTILFNDRFCFRNQQQFKKV